MEITEGKKKEKDRSEKQKVETLGKLTLFP